MNTRQSNNLYRFNLESQETTTGAVISLGRSSIFNGDPELTEKLQNTLAFEDGTRFKDESVINVEGRNIFIKLDSPEITLYDTIQLSGCGHIIPPHTGNERSVVVTKINPDTQLIQPPRTFTEGDTLYTHTTDYFDSEADGLMASTVDLSPIGGYAHALAVRKWDNTARAHSALLGSNVFTPLQQGFVDYPNAVDQTGAAQRGIISLVPNGGRRLGQDFLPLLGSAKCSDEILRYYLDFLSPKLRAVGLAAYIIHTESGFVHNQLTAGNVDPSFTDKDGQQVTFVADWETPTKIDPVYSNEMRALDILKTVRSVTSVPLWNVENQSGDALWTKLAIRMGLDIFAGYESTDTPPVINERTLENVANVMTGNPRLGVESAVELMRQFA